MVLCPQEHTALHLDPLKEGSVSKDLPKWVNSSKPAQPRHPWVSLEGGSADLGPAAAPLLRVIQNQQRGHMPVPVPAVIQPLPPGPLHSGQPTPSPSTPQPPQEPLLTGWAQTLWCTSQWGPGCLLPQAAPRQLRINNLWCIEFPVTALRTQPSGNCLRSGGPSLGLVVAGDLVRALALGQSACSRRCQATTP